MNGYTTTSATSPGVTLAILLIDIAVAVFIIALLWKVFTKAGRPGWAAIIPVYNAYVLCKIAGRSGWWVLLLLVPLVNLVIAIILCMDIARAFGKSGAFGFFGLFLFGLIGYSVLAFGDVRYLGPRRSGPGQPPGYGGGAPGGYPVGPVSAPVMPGYPPAPGSYPPPNPGFPPPAGYRPPGS